MRATTLALLWSLSLAMPGWAQPTPPAPATPPADPALSNGLKKKELPARNEGELWNWMRNRRDANSGTSKVDLPYRFERPQRPERAERPDRASALCCQQ